MIPRISDEEQAAITLSVMAELAAGLTDAHTKYASGARTTNHDNTHLGGNTSRGATFGIGARRSGGRLARFAATATGEVANRGAVALAPDHKAVVEGRTLFPTRVFDADQMQRVLISARSNSKIGGFVTAGRWAGFPIYLLTLEERATCPRSCAVWSECYGNGLPAAVRFRYDGALMDRLGTELTHLSRKHPRGFSVRLHLLGDFPDVEYLRHWARWSDRFKPLHVWGYTAHPFDSEIGRLVRVLNGSRPERWQIRFSVQPGAAPRPMQAAVLWEKPEHTSLHEGALVCPQELGKIGTCGQCGICWKPELAHVRVNFLGHGGRGKKR